MSAIYLIGGKEVEIPTSVFMGGENRYEDWVYLMMLEREWKRTLVEADHLLHIPESARPSPRASVLLVFWSYFETRIDRLLHEATRDLPEKVQRDLLNRYSHVGRRLDRLYRILFDTTYWADLTMLGFPHISDFLVSIQKQRNRFVHGHPDAVGDDLVQRLVESLQDEHEAWIAVFNRRISNRTSK